MKKLFFALMMCIMGLTASAQGIKTVDVKANLRGDFGLGVGATWGMTQAIDLAPSFNYYFGDGANSFTIDGDFHWNIPAADAFTIYPLAGPCIFHVGGDADFTKFGVNLGCGARYDLGKVSVFGEAKYQFLFNANGADDTFFTIGVSFPL